MVVELTIVTIPLLIVAVVGTGLFGLTAKYRGQKGAYSLMGVFAGAVLWSGGYVLELSTGSAIAHYVRFFGAGLVPLFMFLIALHFTGRDDWVTLDNFLAWAGFPGVTLLFMLTNPQHGLWAVPETVGNAAVGEPVSWGPMFYAGSGYLLIMSVIAILMLAERTIKEDGLVTPASVFLVVASIPFTTYSLFVAGATTFDWTPMTFIVSGLLMMYAMFYL